MKHDEVAFEWFERADYESIRDIMEDNHRLPRLFEDWEKSAQAGERALANSRHVVVRTIIDPHSFASWCRERQVKPNAQSRLRYCKEQHASSEPSAEGVGEASSRDGALADQATDPLAKRTPVAERRQWRMRTLGQLRDGVAKMMQAMRS